jgi:hypothetical protein
LSGSLVLITIEKELTWISGSYHKGWNWQKLHCHSDNFSVAVLERLKVGTDYGI